MIDESFDVLYSLSVMFVVLTCMVLFLFYVVVRLVKQYRSLEEKLLSMQNEKWDDSNLEIESLRKRGKTRAQAHLEALLEVNGQFKPVEIINISRTGVLIKPKDEHLELNSIYKIKFVLGTEVIKTDLKIVRIMESQKQYGCSFQYITMSDIGKINSFVNQQAKNELLSEIKELSLSG